MFARATLFAILRRKAIREGIFGGSAAWRTVAFAVIGLRLVRRAFGRTTQIVDVSPMTAGRTMSIVTAAPLNRRRRRRLRETGELLSLADQRRAATEWATEIAEIQQTTGRRPRRLRK